MSAEGGEFGLIDWIRARTGTSTGTVLGIGDDCAILRPGRGELVITTDMLMDGRHFHLDRDGAEAVGFKAMGVNLSDIAAMAARPTAALVAVALPTGRGRAQEVAKGLHAGIAALAGRFSVDLVGGDTNAWDGPLVVSVTLMGEAVGRGPVRRSGARVGDVILVSGPLGGSLLGRHLRPNPRVDEAIAWNEAAAIRAMIDVSDGLASDLGHILEESGGLGAEIEEARVPIHEDAWTMARASGRSALDHALNDGEDFEICLVVAEADVEALLARGPRLFRVGRIEAEVGLRLKRGDGSVEVLRASGFDHLGTASND